MADMTACKPVPPVPPDMLPLQEEPCSEAEMVTPGRALRALLGELDARRVAVDGMTITRLHGTLTLGNGLAVRYSSGWLIWAVGRPSCQQRPLHTLHSAHDPAGAARRLARLAGSRDTDAQGPG